MIVHTIGLPPVAILNRAGLKSIKFMIWYKYNEKVQIGSGELEDESGDKRGGQGDIWQD